MPAKSKDKPASIRTLSKRGRAKSSDADDKMAKEDGGGAMDEGSEEEPMTDCTGGAPETSKKKAKTGKALKDKDAAASSRATRGAPSDDDDDLSEEETEDDAVTLVKQLKSRRKAVATTKSSESDGDPPPAEVRQEENMAEAALPVIPAPVAPVVLTLQQRLDRAEAALIDVNQERAAEAARDFATNVGSRAWMRDGRILKIMKYADKHLACHPQLKYRSEAMNAYQTKLAAIYLALEKDGKLVRGELWSQMPAARKAAVVSTLSHAKCTLMCCVVCLWLELSCKRRTPHVCNRLADV